MSLAKPLHILILPGSWPSAQFPLSGSFTKDFVDTVVENSDTCRLSVFFPGYTEYGASFSEPLSFLNAMWRRFFDRKTILSKKVRIYIRPVLYVYKFGQAYYENKKLKKALKVISDLEQAHGQINLIHAHFSHSAGELAKKIAQHLGVPYIITEHAAPFPMHSGLIKNDYLSKEYFEILDNAKCVIAVSQPLKEKIESYGLTNVMYIPNPINGENFFIHKN